MSSSNANSKPTAPRPTVDEDVDDLDDYLDDFPTKPTPPAPAPSAPTKPVPKRSASKGRKSSTASGKNTPPVNASSTKQSQSIGIDDLNFSDDFAAELAKGMAALMREVAAESDLGGGSSGKEGAAAGEGGGEGEGRDLQQARTFREAWEKMLVEGMNGAIGIDGHEEFGGSAKGKERAGAGGGVGKDDVKSGEEDAFQASIRKAMEKLKESESSHKTESTPGSDPLEALLSQLGEGGGDSEEELQGILESMMAQLMTKEILYEPIKELNDKFPGYLSEHKYRLNAKDKERYTKQQTIAAQIVAIFESPDYSDENTEKTAQVALLMNEVR
ncbi:Pex19-domain-containing protein [Panus rudis PR-1116 ss-1]|nr:Pex19-domain-containing protein [Panus rudis PR-1116 ss-1]